MIKLFRNSFILLFPLFLMGFLTWKIDYTILINPLDGFSPHSVKKIEALLKSIFFFWGALYFLGSAYFLSALSRMEKTVEETLLINRKQKTRIENLELTGNHFINMVSHEFKTPLATLAYQLESLKTHLIENHPGTQKGDPSGKLNPKLDEKLRVLKNQQIRINRTLNNILALSKIQNLDFPLHLKPGNLTQLIEDSLPPFQGESEGKGLVILLENPVPLTFHFDPSLVEIVFNNLLDNAIKFSENSSQIQIKILEENSLGGFSISNPVQPGLSLDGERIFDRFHRGNLSVANGVPGLGLGLYLVKYLLTLHNGEIHLTQGEGEDRITFSVWLPLGKYS